LSFSNYNKLPQLKCVFINLPIAKLMHNTACLAIRYWNRQLLWHKWRQYLKRSTVSWFYPLKTKRRLLLF